MTFTRIAYLRIICEPAGQPRAMPVPMGNGRARMVMDWKFRKGPNRGQYRPAWYFREAVKVAAMLHAPPEPLCGPLRLVTRAYLTRPKYMLAKKYPDGPIPHIVVPDEDNINKLIKDGINDAKIFWTDDRIVFDGRCVKWYAARGCPAWAGITIEAAKSDKMGVLR